jgi:hypothetical protein
MTLSIKPVTPAYVHQIWDSIEKFISDALKWGDDDYTVDQAKVFLANGDWLLVVAVDEGNKIHGASAIRFNNMPNSRVAFVIAMGGKLISNRNTYEQFCNLLKSYGATKIQGTARESTARLWTRYGFKERYKIVEAKI